MTTYNEWLLGLKIDQLEAELGEKAGLIADLQMKNDSLVNLLNTHFALTRGVAS